MTDSSRVDLDALEEEVFAQLHHDPDLLLALIAELRAARAVVEAARSVAFVAQPLRDDHPLYRATNDLRASLADYDRLTK